MAQTSGGIYNLFGLALRVQGDDQHVSSYVFAIKLAGHYQLLKYASNTESLVKEGLASINDKLNQVNTDDVQPTAQVGESGTPLREDQVSNQSAPEEMLANAPARAGNFFKVPKIIE